MPLSQLVKLCNDMFSAVKSILFGYLTGTEESYAKVCTKILVYLLYSSIRKLGQLGKDSSSCADVIRTEDEKQHGVSLQSGLRKNINLEKELPHIPLTKNSCSTRLLPCTALNVARGLLSRSAEFTSYKKEVTSCAEYTGLSSGANSCTCPLEICREGS